MTSGVRRDVQPWALLTQPLDYFSLCPARYRWHQAMATAVLDILAQQAFTPDLLDSLLSVLAIVLQADSWHVRRAALPTLQARGLGGRSVNLASR